MIDSAAIKIELRRVVELLRRYSNRGDLLDDLSRAMSRLQGVAVAPDDEQQPDDIASACPHNPHGRLVSERLAPDDVAELLGQYRSGVGIQQLSTVYKLGKTTVKRLVKLHGGRPQDARYAPGRIADVLARYQTGGTIRELAAEFDIGTTTLKRWIRERGVGRGRW